MNEFVNQYEYTPQIISESVGAWWRKKFRYVPPVCITMIILLIFLFIFTKDYLYLILELCPVLLLDLYFLKIRRAIKHEQERVETISNGSPAIIKVTLNEKIHTESSQTERHVDYSSLEDLVETENLIVLMFKGSMTIALSKTGFLKGNYRDCLTFLHQIISK